MTIATTKTIIDQAGHFDFSDVPVRSLPNNPGLYGDPTRRYPLEADIAFHVNQVHKYLQAPYNLDPTLDELAKNVDERRFRFLRVEYEHWVQIYDYIKSKHNRP